MDERRRGGSGLVRVAIEFSRRSLEQSQALRPPRGGVKKRAESGFRLQCLVVRGAIEPPRQCEGCAKIAFCIRDVEHGGLRDRKFAERRNFPRRRAGFAPVHAVERALE